MKANRIVAVIKLLMLASIIGMSVAAVAKDFVNLTAIKQQLIQYHDSGAYYQDFSTIVKEAMYYLRFRINQNNRSKHPGKLAIVLAVDETALSNYADMVHLNFGGTFGEIKGLAAAGHDAAIPYTLTLYNYAKSHGVAIFFVTARNEYQRSATVRNLENVGYGGWRDLLMEPDNYDEDSIVRFKTEKRKKIMAMGYNIILNIGAQCGDLIGGHADMAFKLPNPYYQVG